MRRSLDRKYAARDSNMELARIISMILITVGHFVLLFGMCQPPDSHFISSADFSSVPAYIPHIALYSLCIEYPRKQLTELLLVALSRKKCGAFISRPIISETSKQS